MATFPEERGGQVDVLRRTWDQGRRDNERSPVAPATLDCDTELSQLQIPYHFL
jgi:hypothetical protein